MPAAAAAGSTSGTAPFEIPFAVPASGGDVKDRLEGEIKKLSGNDAMQKNISVVTDERGIVIRIMDQAFFDEGKAELKDRAKQALDSMAPVIRTISNPIRVEGHTDNTPIATAEFRSNWELSVRRATEVVRYFIEKHDLAPMRISAVGYSEYHPLVPNDTPENRSRNRRIEIIVARSLIEQENKK